MTPEPAFLAIDPPEGIRLPFALTEELTEGIVVIDRESRIRYANPAMTRIFGYGREELAGRPLTILMPEDHRSRHAAGLEEYLATGRRHLPWIDVELPGLHRDGSELELRISFTEFTRRGRRYFCGAIRDVTDGADREAAGRTAARRYGVLFEENAAAVFRAAADGRLLAANAPLADLAGREDREDLEGTDVSGLFAAGPERDVLLEDLAEGRDVRNRELEMRRSDGGTLWVQVDAEWIPTPDGPEPEALVGTVTDVSDRRRAEAELELAEQRYRRLFDQRLVGVYRSRPEPGGPILDCNAAFAEMFGYDGPEAVVGTPGEAFYADATARRKAVEDLRERGTLVEYRLELRRQDGSTLWALVHERLIGGPGEGEVIEGLLFDVSETVEARRAMERARQKFEGIFDISSVAQAIVDPGTGRLLEVNRAFERVFGWERREVEEGAVRGEELWVDTDRRRAVLDRVRGGGTVRQEEVRFRRRDGSSFQGLFSLDSLALENERYLVGAIQDISHLKEVERELEHRAFHDRLTGLPNRSLFWDRLGHALSRSRRTGELIAVLFLDLDGFKRVNDSYGHAAGDEALHRLASRLGRAVRDEDTAARLGGDEFGVVLEDLAREEGAYDVADRLLAEVQLPLQVAGEEVRFQASCGMTFFRGTPDDPEAPVPEPDDLLRQADRAMFAAKEDPGSRWRVFGPDVAEGEPRRLQAEMRLRRGIEEGEFVPFYQPIVSLEDGRLAAAEALARWEDPERGLVPPGEFIPLAEETGLIVPLGHHLLRRSWRDFARWRADGLVPPGFRLHLNLSGRQLRDPDLVASVGALLEDGELDPRELAFEITETGAMGRAEVMAQLQELGVRISVDDFGTQYATLDRLTRLDVDSLKVDRAFVDRMTDSRRHAAIVEATLALTRALEISAVAEGIETTEQLDRLRELGCDFGQGFLFARPVPVGEFTTWLEEGRSWPVGS